jgi:hypothetical protein
MGKHLTSPLANLFNGLLEKELGIRIFNLLLRCGRRYVSDYPSNVRDSTVELIEAIDRPCGMWSRWIALAGSKTGSNPNPSRCFTDNNSIQQLTAPVSSIRIESVEYFQNRDFFFKTTLLSLDSG